MRDSNGLAAAVGMGRIGYAVISEGVMESVRRFASSAFLVFGLAALAGVPVLGGSHSWAPWEFYSNPDGTIQYIVLWNPTASGETGIATRDIRSNANISGQYGSNLPAGSTADKFLLGATAGFAALPGAPTPDFPILVDNFFNTGGQRRHREQPAVDPG